MRDTISLQDAYDSLRQIDVITTKIQTDNQILTQKVDSLITANKELSLSQNYFSDIISSQMAWFGILFGITFGVLGLIYWLGIIRYFNNKFKLIELNINDIQAIENVNNKRLDDKIENNNNRLQVSEKSLEDKIKNEVKIIEQRFTSVNEKIDNSIEQNSSELRDIIEEQKRGFEVDKQKLIDQINDVNFDVHRSMFFTNYNKKDYYSAFTWVLPMLHSLTTRKKTDEEKISIWIRYAIICLDKLTYTKKIETRIDGFNRELDLIKGNLSNEKFIKDVEVIKLRINKLYYSNIDPNLSEDE